MKVSMIYMASGFGKRYGTNKLITEFRGEPLYLHGLLSLQKAAKLHICILWQTSPVWQERP